LIGTSIALDLQDLGWETLGWDPNPDALDGAARTGAVTPIESLDAVTLGTGDLLILAAPPSAVRSTLRELETAALVIDVASVKAPILEVVHRSRRRPTGALPWCYLGGGAGWGERIRRSGS
jgi:prephenate dehydrogenase